LELRTVGHVNSKGKRGNIYGTQLGEYSSILFGIAAEHSHCRSDPALAKPRAIARPMPPLPPVTTAT